MDFLIKKKINARMIKNLALNIELHINNYMNWNISEYQVQHFMTSFLANSLNNTDYQVREEKDKVDCVIQTKEKNHSIKKPEKLILYELKTFIKPSEKLNYSNSATQILKDLRQLKKSINENKKLEGYFILATTKNKIKNPENIHEDLLFIFNYKNDSEKWTEIKDENENKICKIRPAGQKNIGETYVFIWEVK